VACDAGLPAANPHLGEANVDTETLCKQTQHVVHFRGTAHK